MRTPHFVPLPEVTNYSDQIDVQSLDLPVDFDQGRLGFNVRAISRVMQWGALNHLTICSRMGKSRDTNTSTGLGKHSANKVSLQEATIRTSPDIEPFGSKEVEVRQIGAVACYGKAEATIKINSTEKEQRINESQKRWPKGADDPAAQAHFIDMAIRDGLKRAALKNHGSVDKIALQISTTAMFAGTEIVDSLTALDCPIVTIYFAAQGLHAVQTKREYGLSFSDRQWSLFFGIPFDRHIVARAHANRRLVKALDGTP